MNKQLCFILDDKEIYLDKCLVYFNETPIFFVCADLQKRYYLVLCTDIDALEYVIVGVNKKCLWRMLTKSITMREALLSSDVFWSVKAGDEIYSDAVELLKVSNMDYDILPDEGAVYEEMSEEDKAYVDRITCEYLEAMSFDDLEPMVDLDEVSIESIGLSFISGADAVVEYSDFGPSTHNMSNGFKRMFSNKSDVAESMMSYKQPPKAKKMISLNVNNYDAVEINYVINIAA